MKAIPCVLITNSPLTGYEFTPQKCNSIRQALTLAKYFGFPYRIEVNGQVIRKGWYKNERR